MSEKAAKKRRKRLGVEAELASSGADRVAWGDLWWVEPGGAFKFAPHFGQAQALETEKRFILVLAGSQSGKTSFAPFWLYREIRRRGPGTYGVVGPTDGLLHAKAIPEFLRLFRDTFGLGRFIGSPRPQFLITSRRAKAHLFDDPDAEDVVIQFGHGSDPESLESATWKAAWLDEAGQKMFRAASWEAIRRRLSLNLGRALITTTPYRLGWLKTELYDRRDDPSADVAVISFPSIANPAFPRSEFESQKKRMPRWLFNMMYRGRFEKPAGIIYDAFRGKGEPHSNIIPWFNIPDHWPRLLGLDFGGVNTAAVFLAEELNRDGSPTGRVIAYREYLAGGRSATEHARELYRGERGRITAVGGSKSEGQWRTEFAGAEPVGLPIYEPPIADVEVGILRVYEAIKTRRLVILEGTCPELQDQLSTYSRELDDNGQPTEKIEDKNAFHYLDALRYILAWYMHDVGEVAVR